MKKIAVTDCKRWLVPFITIIIFLISTESKTQWVNPFLVPFQNTQSFAVPTQDKQPETTSTKSPVQAGHGNGWERIQTIEIPQYDATGKALPPVKLNLDQVRNGSGTSPVVPPAVAPWVNGNAGASNAHYAEGWSIPYRCVITDLPLGAHSINIEWDARQSNSSAIDFVTNYDLIDYPAGSHVNSFGHSQEVLNPILGESGSFSSGASSVIPTPSFPGGAPAGVNPYYTAIMGTTFPGDPSKNANKFTIYNGNITDMDYLLEGNVTVAASSTTLRIFFTNTSSTVIISWGGHIAKGEGVWGNGNSASAVSGSPYHTRLISWDPDGDGPGGSSSIGNQDRSLSADAVLDPPTCTPGGPSSLECSGVSTFTSGVAASDLGAGNTFDWSITNNGTCNATIVDESHVNYVTVNSGSGCNCSFTVRFTLFKNNVELSHCDKNVTVNDATAPLITCPSDVNLACGGSTSTANTGTATASDNCGTPTISFTDAAVASNCTGRAGVNRTWKATDACGNTATCLQQIRFVDNTAPQITCPSNANLSCGASTSTDNTGTATASDNCGTPTISFTDAAVASNCTGRAGIDRTWKATDGCGNTATCLQQIRFVDNTAPQITCPSNVNLQCGQATSTDNTGRATATDNCGANPTLTFSDAAVASNCTGRAGVDRTWKATDGCGNTATCMQQILFVDNSAPQITCPADIVIECSASATDLSVTGSATATDNCGPVTPTYTDNTQNRGCVTYIRRTWRATDGCGNSATCLQNITKRDRTGPVINCTSGTATDNCSPQGDITIYLSNNVWTAIDGSGNITTATFNCSQQGPGRMFTSQVTEQQNEQPITVTEEKTISSGRGKHLPSGVSVQAIPNPFNDRVKFVITTTESGYGSLDVMNMLGQKVKTVFQGQMNAGTQTFEMSLPQSRFSTLLYILRIDGKQVTGKLIQRN